MYESSTHAGRHFTREEIRRRLRDPMLAIANALPRTSWEEQRIPGSISLPLEEIPDHAHERLPDREQEIAVYCGGPT